MKQFRVILEAAKPVVARDSPASLAFGVDAVLARPAAIEVGERLGLFAACAALARRIALHLNLVRSGAGARPLVAARAHFV